MIQEALNSIHQVLGLGADDLSVGQMAARAFTVYIAALIMVRLGEKRFLGKNTAFDVILGIILGSVVSRAITGSAEFFPTLGAGLVLVGMHWLFAMLAFRSDRFGTLIKGSPRLLVKDGNILWDAMRKSNISQNDLLGALRSEGQLSDPVNVKEARLERSGNISVIEAGNGPKILQVAATEGVQTIRIQIE